MAALLLSAVLAAQEVPKVPGTVVFSTDQAPRVEMAKAAAAVPGLTAEERNALTVTGYDLDVHLVPGASRITVRARLELRNDGMVPLRYVALQVSSSLRWESVALAGAKANFAQQVLDTDADHTGRANEAVITLQQPLAVGASVSLTAFYSGEIHVSAERLERIGAPPAKAAAADWDAITPELTAMRGFGDLLWYPVAAEPVFLGDGAKLFQEVGRQRLRQAGATMRLRLTVEYVGDPPDAAIFCGRRMPMVATSENKDLPVAESPGVATAEFAATRLGFRAPSLFVTDRAATVTTNTLIAAVTDHYDALPPMAAGAALVRPLLATWLGAQPLTQLQIIDHAGQPFEDGAFVVLPLRAVEPVALADSLVYPLAHAWFRSAQPWLDEGVPQMMSLLWTERQKGREAAVDVLGQGARTLALAEPEVAKEGGGQPLVAARDDVFFRTKAAAVLWMLRSIAGEDALKQTLAGYRDAAGENRESFELILEKNAHKDLRWFFEDWVYRDRGLPDLTVASVTPRELEARNGKLEGWLVAVEVRNDGDAVAEVSVTVRFGASTAAQRLRIAGRSSASVRMLVGGTPDEVQVNDGTVPEMRTSVHRVRVK